MIRKSTRASRKFNAQYLGDEGEAIGEVGEYFGEEGDICAGAMATVSESTSKREMMLTS